MGVKYIVDVIYHAPDDVEVFLEYEDHDDEVYEDELLFVTKYLLDEGFITKKE
jgi:hypothetical protein